MSHARAKSKVGTARCTTSSGAPSLNSNKVSRIGRSAALAEKRVFLENSTSWMLATSS